MAADPELPNHSHLDEVTLTVGRLFVRALAAGWKITENPKATPGVDRRFSGHAGWFAAIKGSTSRRVVQQSSRLFLELPSASVVR